MREYTEETARTKALGQGVSAVFGGQQGGLLGRNGVLDGGGEVTRSGRQ